MIQYHLTRIRNSIATDTYRNHRLVDFIAIYVRYDSSHDKAYRTLTHQHRAGTFVGEDFGEEGIAIAAADDVGAVNSPA